MFDDLNNFQSKEIFFKWYNLLCSNLYDVSPIHMKKPTTLDIIADQMEFKDWIPILIALKDDRSLHSISIKSDYIGNFLDNINTKEKAWTLEKDINVLWTQYIWKKLLKSLICCIKETHNLTVLKFEGVPFFQEYLKQFLFVLEINKSVKALSFKNSRIKDEGCFLVCKTLSSVPTIEIIDFTQCDLTFLSANYLSKLIKTQQLHRYITTWHNSLRIGGFLKVDLKGLKRIRLNNNPHFGDKGVLILLDAIEDDLWINAIDLQNTGITESISKNLIDVLKYNKSINIFDVRNNYLTEFIILNISNILKTKTNDGDLKKKESCICKHSRIFSSKNDLLRTRGDCLCQYAF